VDPENPNPVLDSPATVPPEVAPPPKRKKPWKRKPKLKDKDIQAEVRRLQKARESQGARPPDPPKSRPPGRPPKSSSSAAKSAEEVYGDINRTMAANLTSAGKSKAFFNYAVSMMEHGQKMWAGCALMTPEGHFDLVIKALNNVTQESGPTEDTREFVGGWLRGDRPDFINIRIEELDEFKTEEEEDDEPAS
jgi:hypothetical protein